MDPVVTALIAFLYFLPTGLAWSRHHYQSTAILLLNLFLGWTVVGWIVALVWAATSPTAAQVVGIAVPGAAVVTVPPATPPFSATPTEPREVVFCAKCGKKRDGTLNFCRHCGASLA